VIDAAHADGEQIAAHLERLTIGQFAHISALTVPMLRRYDRAGLLRPAFRDARTGYRYYSWRQLNRAETIRMLRSLAVPLAEIRVALERGGDLESIVERQRRRIEARIAHDRNTLLRLECMLVHGGPLVNPQCTLRDVPALPVVSLRYATTLAGAAESENAAWQVLSAFVERHDVAVVGPSLVVSHRLPLRSPHSSVDARYAKEACLPVSSLPQGDGRVRGGILPACRVATTLLHGPYDDIRHAHWAVLEWLLDQGYEPAGPARQVYLVTIDDSDDPRDYLTEIMQPVTIAGAGAGATR